MTAQSLQAPIVQRVNDHVELTCPRLGADSPTVRGTVDQWSQLVSEVQAGKRTAGVLRLRKHPDGVIKLWNAESQEGTLTLSNIAGLQFMDRLHHGDYDIEKLPERPQDSLTSAEPEESEESEDQEESGGSEEPGSPDKPKVSAV